MVLEFLSMEQQPAMPLASSRRSRPLCDLQTAEKEVTQRLQTHYEAMIAELQAKLEAKESEIARIREEARTNDTRVQDWGGDIKQVTEAMKLAALYREKYYRTRAENECLQREIATFAQKKPLSPFHSRISTADSSPKKPSRGLPRTTPSSPIICLLPEGEMTPVRHFPLATVRQKAGNGGYLPSFRRVRRGETLKNRPESRFADEFPEEKELEG